MPFDITISCQKGCNTALQWVTSRLDIVKRVISGSPQYFSQNILSNILGKYIIFRSKIAIPSATLKIRPSNAVFLLNVTLK